MDLERLCDAIAAEILVPATVLTRLLVGGPPEPGHLRQLYATSSASEEVCAIVLASRIPVRGLCSSYAEIPRPSRSPRAAATPSCASPAIFPPP